MKKLFFLFVICVAAFSLTFCGQQKPAEKPAADTQKMESAAPDSMAADSMQADTSETMEAQ